MQTSVATATDSSKSSGLGSGVKVGVGVGCTIAGLSLLAALTYVLLRSKSERQKIGSEPHRPEERRNSMVYQKAELSDEHARHELPDTLQELPGESQSQEFPGE